MAVDCMTPTPGCWRVSWTCFERRMEEIFDSQAEMLAFIRQLRPDSRRTAWRLDYSATHMGDTRWRRVRMPKK